jgi:hypothetical protein
MKCPFRVCTHTEYTNVDDQVIAVSDVIEDYPDCYENECPLYQWDSIQRGYRCVQAELQKQSVEDSEYGEEPGDEFEINTGDD